MKILFKILSSFLVVLGLSSLAHPLFANHILGGQLNYVVVAPNTYAVNLTYLRDCSGIIAPSNAFLKISSTGCNVGRSLPLTQVNRKAGNFYCASLGASGCSTTGSTNYEEVIYSTTLSFTASEQACPDWKLSWFENGIPNFANLINSNNDIYIEAFVKLNSGSTPISGTSPQFLQPLGQFLNALQPAELSCLANDPDGDSLVYSLQAPVLSNGNTIPFSSFSPNFNYIFNPADSTQIAFYKAGTFPLSAVFPIPAFKVDWNQPAPRYLNQDFQFNSQNGSLKFSSPAQVPASTAVQYNDKNSYVFKVQVDEYRKIGGVPVKIGSVSQLKVLHVAKTTKNLNPDLTNIIANGQAIAPATIINLRPGTTLALTFDTQDANGSDSLLLESNVTTLLPGSTFQKTTVKRPAGTIFWTPTATQVRDQIYYFNVVVKDNACPLTGIVQKTFGVKVSNSGSVTGVAGATQTQSVFTAYPNPFSTQITFKIRKASPQDKIVIYNVLGQVVDQLSVFGRINTEQEIVWLNAAKFPAGQYLVRFSGAFDQTLKINKLQ